MKKTATIQFILILILIIASSIIMPISDHYRAITFKAYIYFIVRIIIYVLLGVITSIPKIIEYNKFKINYIFIILESVLIFSMVFMFYRFAFQETFRPISFAIGYFLINCIKIKTEDVENLN